MKTHPNVIAVQDALDATGARTAEGRPSRVIVLDDAVHTAAAAAAALAAYDAIWAAGGVPRAVFPITPAELLRMTAGAPTEVA